MARKQGSKSEPETVQGGVQGAGGKEPEEVPWYQYTDWWEGLSNREIESRIRQAGQEAGPGGWVVVPTGYLSRPKYVPSSDELIEAVRHIPPNVVIEMPESQSMVLARDIYMELTRTKGYSPEHAKNAWKGARDFEREGADDGNSKG